MSLSILQSIHPKYCELIASGKKTIEVRKTKPRIPTPFKVYIYSTKNVPQRWFDETKHGKVIGEYVCDKIKEFPIVYNKKTDTRTIKRMTVKDLDNSYLDLYDISKYAGNAKVLYGYHISNLKIYDKPKELSEFKRKCENEYSNNCKFCKYGRLNADYDYYGCEYNGYASITRAPQSWCYVEEL